jgi:hypothetical protein
MWPRIVEIRMDMTKDEQSVGRGAADRVVPEVNVDWRRPGQRER